MATKFEDAKAKVERFCLLNSQYKINDSDSQKEAILIDGPDGKLITLSIEKGKVKCSDPAFQEDLMNLEDSGGYLPVPLQDDDKQNIKALAVDIPNLGKLSPEGIRAFINPKATGQEIVDHLLIASSLGLSVIKKEIYLVKRNDGTVSHQAGLNAFTRRAAENPNISHYKCGIIVTKKGQDEPIFKPGSFKMKAEDLVGGWCNVFFKDGREPITHTVSLEEYDQKEQTRGPWAVKKCTMIEKVAKVQALRMAAPIECNGIYTTEEMADPSKEIKMEA